MTSGSKSSSFSTASSLKRNCGEQVTNNVEQGHFRLAFCSESIERSIRFDLVFGHDLRIRMNGGPVGVVLDKTLGFLDYCAVDCVHESEIYAIFLLVHKFRVWD